MGPPPCLVVCEECIFFFSFFFLKIEKNCYNWSQPVFVIVCSFPSLTGIGGKNGFLGLGCFLGEEKSVVSAQRTSYDIFLFFGKECVEWTSTYRKNERVVQVRQQCQASQPRPVGGCVQNGAVCCCKENGEVNGETAMHLQDIKSVISQWCVRERLFSHCQCKTSYFYYHFWQIWLPSDCRSGQLTDQLLILVHFFFLLSWPSPFLTLFASAPPEPIMVPLPAMQRQTEKLCPCRIYSSLGVDFLFIIIKTSCFSCGFIKEHWCVASLFTLTHCSICLSKHGHSCAKCCSSSVMIRA